MSQVFLCPRCKARVERPNPDVVKMWCWQCGKKLNFEKEPRQLQREPEPVQPIVTERPGAGHDLPRQVTEASAHRPMPSFRSRPTRQPTLDSTVRHYHPPRRSPAFLFIGSALVSALVVTAILIGYMLVIANLDQEASPQANLGNGGPAIPVAPQPNPSPRANESNRSNVNSGSTIPSDPNVLFPPRDRTQSAPGEVARNTSPRTPVTQPPATQASPPPVDISRPNDIAFPPRDIPSTNVPANNNLPSSNISGLANIKSATALVIHPRRKGAAFCVDDRGVFVTDSRLLDGLSQGDFVRIVTNAGEAGAKQYDARIALSDSRNQIALLTANSNESFSVVKLGEVARLKEADEVVALGYPTTQGSFPAVQANPGQVATIVRESGVITRILTGARLELAGLGGPLINTQGEVIGVVSSQPGATRVDAIPIDKVREAVQWTFAKVVAPVSIPVENLRDPFAVHLDVFSQSESAMYANVYVALTKQEFQMTQLQDHFSATVDLGGRPIDPRAVSSVRIIVRVFEGTNSGSRDKRLLSIIHDIKIAKTVAEKKMDYGDRGKAQ